MGNRTLVLSLEGSRSAIELYPLRENWWGEKESNLQGLSHRIYSPARFHLRTISPKKRWCTHGDSNPGSCRERAMS